MENKQYSESSISEFERNKPVETRKKIVDLIKKVSEMQHFDKVFVLNALEQIKESLENGR